MLFDGLLRFFRFRWTDLENGKLEVTEQEVDQNLLKDTEFIESYFWEKAGIGILWPKGVAYIPGMKAAAELPENQDLSYNCIVKVDKNRYAVSGLNQTTDPYTQVIKLVDSQLRPVSTVTFSLKGREKLEEIGPFADSLLGFASHFVPAVREGASRIGLLPSPNKKRGWFGKG